jgi:hypothetical protein
MGENEPKFFAPQSIAEKASKETLLRLLWSGANEHAKSVAVVRD